MGAESGSQKILDAMEKGTRVDQIAKARENLRHEGIRACYFLQFGYPGETWQDIQNTIRLVRDTRPDDIGVSVSYPLPGTKFFDRVRAQLGDKTNWSDSEDLAMMFQGAYTNEFYRALHDALHAQVDSWNSSSAHGAEKEPQAKGQPEELWRRVMRLEKTCRNSTPTILGSFSDENCVAAASPGSCHQLRRVAECSRQLIAIMDILLTHGYFLYEDPKELQIMKPYPPLGILYICSHLAQAGSARGSIRLHFFFATEVVGPVAARASVNSRRLCESDDARERDRDSPGRQGSWLANDRRRARSRVPTSANIWRRGRRSRDWRRRTYAGGTGAGSAITSHSTNFIQIDGIAFRAIGRVRVRTKPREQIKDIDAQPWPARECD